MKTALVTGGSRGIGAAVAKSLLDRGWSVVAASRSGRLPPGLPRDAAIQPLAMDVASTDSVQSAAWSASAKGVALDALVHGAAIIAPDDEDLLSLSEQTLRDTLETNLFGALRVVQAFWPLLARGGRVVLVSSGGGSLSSPADWSPAYCLSKTALNGLAGQLSIAGRARGIDVNAVCPGWVRTDMGGEGAPRSPEEGARGIVWLAAEAPAGTTGGFWRDGKRIPW